MPSVTVIVFSLLIAAAHAARAQDANIVADAIRHIQNDDPDPAPENRLKYVNIIEHERAVKRFRPSRAITTGQPTRTSKRE